MCFFALTLLYYPHGGRTLCKLEAKYKSLEHRSSQPGFKVAVLGASAFNTSRKAFTSLLCLLHRFPGSIFVAQNAKELVTYIPQAEQAMGRCAQCTNKRAASRWSCGTPSPL
jgi:hypothetical protein